MSRLPTIVLAVAVTAAGCGRSGGPFPPGTLGYGFPSPPHAAYEIADTALVTVHTDAGDLENEGGYVLNLDLGFDRDPAGVRVRGIVADIEGSLRNPGAPTRRPRAIGPLAETHDFVIDRRGVVEVRSFPTISGPAALLFSFAGHAHDLFPRLAEGVVDPGATWPDTVRWHIDAPEAEVSYRATQTYTIMGDTLVDERALVHIAVSGELDTVIVTGTPGDATFRVLKGPVTGLVFWDPERALIEYAEYERDLEGTLERPDRRVLDLSLRGLARFRLQR